MDIVIIPLTQMCEKTWTELTFGPPAPTCEMDVMLAIDCSGSIVGNGNVQAMQESCTRYYYCIYSFYVIR